MRLRCFDRHKRGDIHQQLDQIQWCNPHGFLGGPAADLFSMTLQRDWIAWQAVCPSEYTTSWYSFESTKPKPGVSKCFWDMSPISGIKPLDLDHLCVEIIIVTHPISGCFRDMDKPSSAWSRITVSSCAARCSKGAMSLRWILDIAQTPGCHSTGDLAKLSLYSTYEATKMRIWINGAVL